MLSRPSLAPQSKKSWQQLSTHKTIDIALELDLRGLRVEEALDLADKYLDDAILANVPRVRVIHGKGTGALRQAFTQFLREDRRIDHFRLGEAGEGGDGVTVVYFEPEADG